MTDNRPWTQYEDRILKFIRDQQGIQKWSTIAQKMIEQYAIKGRNGKHCKQRYMEVFDQNNSVLHWDYDSQQLLFMLHDNIGNKWANIGQQLGGRTDNDVKNHFYSKIRKGLRKLNSIIKSYFKKQFKQIKQNILYKIIEGAQDRFTTTPIYDEQIWNYCRGTCICKLEAKNILLKMGYDEVQYNSWNQAEKYKNEIRNFIEGLLNFSKQYQRKPKNILRKNEQFGLQKMTNLHTSYRIPPQSVVSYSASNYDQSQQDSQQSENKKQGNYQNKKQGKYQNKQQGNYQNKNISRKQQSSYYNSQQIKNEQKGYYWQMKMQIPIQKSQRRGQKVNSVIILKSSGDMNSMLDEIQSTEMQHKNDNKQFKNNNHNYNNTSIQQHTNKSLLPSIPKLVHISTKMNAMIDEQDEDQLTTMRIKSNQFDQDIQFQLMKQGILEEDQQDNQYHQQTHTYQQNNTITRNIQPIKSKGSNFSSYSIEDQDCPFFTQDSTLNMRIFTTGIGGKKGQEMFASTQKSDKLFKSLDSSGKLFQSFDLKGKRQFAMSIQRSGQMKNQDFI